MSNRRALKGAIAAIASAATLGALAAPALANETSTYNLNGKSVAELTQHGGAQRIAAIGNGNAKNVILFIGDGMGDSEITVARDYLKGANGHFEGLDAVGQSAELGDTNAGTGQYTTFSLGGNSGDSAVGKNSDGSLNANPNPGKLTAVTDSSASGSAWATGTKTYNNAVDVDVYGNPQLNLFELAKAAGKATGNVTTAEIQDATPAVLESHSTERGCYGPQGKTDGSSNDALKRCLANQLKEQGMEDKYQDLLDEMPRVRKDLGFPPLVTPSSQIVGTMATFNVMMGQRYKMVPREFKDLARGKFGHTPVPVDKEFLHSIGIKDEDIITDCAAEDAKAATMADFRKELTEKGYPNASEEDVLSYALFPQVAEEFFSTHRSLFTGYETSRALSFYESALLYRLESFDLFIP